MLQNNLYKILQVDPTAEADVIEAAYRALTAKLHPERDITGVDEYRMKELERAYAVLRDPQRRAAYDAEHLRASQVPVGPGPSGSPASSITGSGSLAERMSAHDADGLADIRVDFGRYQGWTLGDLMRSDPDYLRWLSRHSSGIRYRGAIMRLLAAHEGQRTPLRAPR